MALVAAHHLGDRAAVRLRQRQQLGPGAEGQRQHGGVGRDDLLPRAVGRDLVADDETATHGIVGARRQLGPGRVEGAQPHAVGMKGQTLAAVEDEVAPLVEGDRRPARAAAQHQPPPGADGLQQRRHRLHVHRVGLVPGQPQQHGLVAAVALAGGAERAEELALHPRRAVQHPVGCQPEREHPRRPHRAHGVRAARPDADLEEVEDRDCHEVRIIRARRSHHLARCVNPRDKCVAVRLRVSDTPESAPSAPPRAPSRRSAAPRPRAHPAGRRSGDPPGAIRPRRSRAWSSPGCPGGCRW